MRLDWIFLPRENPCAKFYIIIIKIIMIIMIMKTVMKTSKALMCTGRGYSLYDAIFFYRVK